MTRRRTTASFILNPMTNDEDMTMADPAIRKLLDFWLEEVGPEGWYAGGAALDQKVRDGFQKMWEQAEALAPGWMDSAEGALAAMILTDQLPRNMFREDPRAFATDPLALRLAREAIAKGYHEAIDPPGKQFFFLPFEHSEDIEDQEYAIAMFEQHMPGEHVIHAKHHRDAIAAFGRFPWRNNALGRTSTPAEQEILDAGGYGALVSGKVSLAR